MRKVTKAKLQEILTRRLHLSAPEFRLKAYGARINGHIISDSFKGKRDLKRQQLIWDALEDELGTEVAQKSVGMLLAYTPYEWDPFARPANGRAKVMAGK
jgi:acid stress-induced BolA-like protein IbaG/YrbA